MQQLRISKGQGEPLGTPDSQLSGQEKGKAPIRQEQLRREPETSMPYSFSGQPVRHHNGQNRKRNRNWNDSINQVDSRPFRSQPYYDNNPPIRHPRLQGPSQPSNFLQLGPYERLS
ncbi:hypothetical protein GcM1_182023 [Golovinomyces cichoracearum]|uniref:Uncharacterized protein n=1 Tax=Golovinomyces cichoracearum TaxID=62708 RepID=A0A420J418_9PEZI|nr:hypothetical protein GcM1_182023 [Golovinomyces cichoracearum]